jgi:TolB-like protein
MKEKSLSVLLVFTFIWLLPTSSSWAGQVVTKEVKLWAKEALQQEKALKTTTAPNTLAVLYFHNKTGWSKLDLLQKGLTLMLITDLSRLKEIQVVERIKIQALVEELGLGVSGVVEAKTAPRVGRLLGVQHLVGGDIVKGKMEDFQLKSDLLKVPTERVFGQPMAEGKLLSELFRMEKDLLFEIIKLLRIEVSPKLRKELEQPLTTSIEALLYLLQGIEYSDLRNYVKANESYDKALKEDPGLTLGSDAVGEIQKLFSPPDGGKKPCGTGGKKPCASNKNNLRNSFRRR